MNWGPHAERAAEQCVTHMPQKCGMHLLPAERLCMAAACIETEQYYLLLYYTAFAALQPAGRQHCD